MYLLDDGRAGAGASLAPELVGLLLDALGLLAELLGLLLGLLGVGPVLLGLGRELLGLGLVVGNARLVSLVLVLVLLGLVAVLGRVVHVDVVVHNLHGRLVVVVVDVDNNLLLDGLAGSSSALLLPRELLLGVNVRVHVNFLRELLVRMPRVRYAVRRGFYIHTYLLITIKGGYRDRE